jgi:phosphoglycolate phosphatase-like HAD superfamily hydrolase
MNVIPQPATLARLAVLDIDGTLTDTNAVDDACFLRAVGETLGIKTSGVDWSAAPHVTDSALVLWLAEQHGRLPLSDRMVSLVVDRFLELLEAERALSVDAFRPVAGADRLFPALATGGWTCALATGGWERSARLKLAAAGLHTSTLALASSSDASTRSEIMQLAAVRAQRDAAAFERIVSIGDAVWDVRAAGELHWSFIGIATGNRATILRQHGATTILADFSDLPAVLSALAEAEPPRVVADAPVA